MLQSYMLFVNTSNQQGDFINQNREVLTIIIQERLEAEKKAKIWRILKYLYLFILILIFFLIYSIIDNIHNLQNTKDTIFSRIYSLLQQYKFKDKLDKILQYFAQNTSSGENDTYKTLNFIISIVFILILSFICRDHFDIGLLPAILINSGLLLFILFDKSSVIGLPKLQSLLNQSILYKALFFFAAMICLILCYTFIAYILSWILTLLVVILIVYLVWVFFIKSKTTS